MVTSDERNGAIAGISVAFIELLTILVENKTIEIKDWDRIIATLDNLQTRYGTKPSQREAIEGYSTTLKTMRRRLLANDPSTPI